MKTSALLFLLKESNWGLIKCNVMQGKQYLHLPPPSPLEPSRSKCPTFRMN